MVHLAGQFAAQRQVAVDHLVDDAQHQIGRAGRQLHAVGPRLGRGGIEQSERIGVTHRAVDGMHGQQHMVKDGKAHWAGVKPLEHRRAAALDQLGWRLVRLCQAVAAQAGSQAPKHQRVVLRGVVVMRRQLVVQQVGHMQVHQLGAAQLLQRGLNGRQHDLKLAPSARNPDKALRR